jgi:hypothetical protein
MGTAQQPFLLTLLTTASYIIVIPTDSSFFLAIFYRWFLVRLIFDPEDGDDTFLRNVGSCIDYTKMAIFKSDFGSKYY